MGMVLRQVSATGGFLENCRVALGPGLNCIIGPRGTCKSTLVESIRFAFDADPDRVKRLTDPGRAGVPDSAGLITATLGGATVRCEIRDQPGDDPAAGTSYTIERDLGGEPRIYCEGVKDHADAGVRNQIEIYSQGDLQRIAEDDRLRLALVDRPHRRAVREKRAEQQKAAERLRALGPEIRELRARAAGLRDELRGLPELQSQLAAVRRERPELSRELEDRRAAHLRRQAALAGADRAVAAVNSAADAALSARPRLDDLNAALEQIRRQSLDETAALEKALAGAAKALGDLLTAAEKLRARPLAEARGRLAEEIAAADEPYYALRRQEQAANESLKKEDVLKRQIEHLEGLAGELERTEARLVGLTAQRNDLRAAIARLADEVFALRAAEVERINSRHKQLVILNLEHGASGREYEDEILAVLAKSRLRGKEDLAREIAAALPPSELVDLVEAGDAAALATALNRDAAAAARLMTALMESPDLHRLEGRVFEDRLHMTMYDDGRPKPVHTLSKGQKATALLPLILRPADHPLIIDQPEDDLDNRFIFHSLVRAVRELKTQRQLIFVTHNANIPVIGEAETVVVMKMESPVKAAAPTTGTVDERQKDIVDLLEGGAEAFRERQRRYQLSGPAK